MKPHPRRLQDPGDSSSCPHRPPCPGCPRFGEQGIAAAVRGTLEDLAAGHGLSGVPLICGSTAGFRHRARLAIRGRLGSPKLGLFESGTHRVVHIPRCSVHHPLINRVAAVVRRALVDARITCYSDKAHLGLARYLQVAVERSSQTAQVVIVANSATAEPLAGCLDLIAERLGSDLHSLWYNANCQRSNSILGPDFHHWRGPASVVEHFGGAAVHYPPGAFGQNNLDLSQVIIDHVRLAIPPGAQAAEFYAGVGAIGLSVLDRVSCLQLNEISPQSLFGLDLGLAELGAADRAKISIVRGAAGEAYLAASGAQVVIANPPRRGLDSGLSGYLAARPPSRFLYVSCGLESLLRDVHALTAGRLRLKAFTAFNLLPYTDHVETLACFDRE